jgi:hypothetical protein
MRSLDDVRSIKAAPDKSYVFVAFRPQAPFSDQFAAS